MDDSHTHIYNKANKDQPSKNKITTVCLRTDVTHVGNKKL